jgi:hypothetical protein
MDSQGSQHGLQTSQPTTHDESEEQNTQGDAMPEISPRTSVEIKVEALQGGPLIEVKGSIHQQPLVEDYTDDSDNAEGNENSRLDRQISWEPESPDPVSGSSTMVGSSILIERPRRGEPSMNFNGEASTIFQSSPTSEIFERDRAIDDDWEWNTRKRRMGDGRSPKTRKSSSASTMRNNLFISGAEQENKLGSDTLTNEDEWIPRKQQDEPQADTGIGVVDFGSAAGGTERKRIMRQPGQPQRPLATGVRFEGPELDENRHSSESDEIRPRRAATRQYRLARDEIREREQDHNDSLSLYHPTVSRSTSRSGHTSQPIIRPAPRPSLLSLRREEQALSHEVASLASASRAPSITPFTEYPPYEDLYSRHGYPPSLSLRRHRERDHSVGPTNSVYSVPSIQNPLENDFSTPLPEVAYSDPSDIESDASYDFSLPSTDEKWAAPPTEPSVNQRVSLRSTFMSTTSAPTPINHGVQSDLKVVHSYYHDAHPGSDELSIGLTAEFESRDSHDGYDSLFRWM